MAQSCSLQRKPPWLRRKVPGGDLYSKTLSLIRSHNVHTVCESASCPNLGECWAHNTATLMILGDKCTRNCGFCGVTSGHPEGIDRDEPARVGQVIQELKLKHAVITSVTRDDLIDKGAVIWAQTIKSIKQAAPLCSIEVLIPDMSGTETLLDIILDAGPHILGHNLETVPRLQSEIRKQACFEHSIGVLRYAKSRGFITKTGLMAGLGESDREIKSTIKMCGSSGIDILTIGQYLQPSISSLPVKRFVSPEGFKQYEKYALKQGIKVCESAPLVRSSYRAQAALTQLHRSGDHNEG